MAKIHLFSQNVNTFTENNVQKPQNRRPHAGKSLWKRASAGVLSLVLAARVPSWCEVSVRCDEGFEGKVPVLHAKGRETKMTIPPFGPSLMDEVLYLRPVIKGKGAPKAGFIIQEGESAYGT